MPICPNCGSPRIDKYCANCGAAATRIIDKRDFAAPAPPRAVPSSLPTSRPKSCKSGGAAWVFFGMLMLAILVLRLLAVHSLRTTRSPVISNPMTSPRGNVASFVNDFESEADIKISTGRISLSSAVGIPSITDMRLSNLKSEIDKVAGLRENLARALQRTRLENAWPIEVSGYEFSRPSQVQAAIQSADDYLRRGAAAEAEMIRASEASHRLQQQGDRILAQMQQIRTDLHLIAVGQRSSDMTSLREKHAKFVELNADLSTELHNSSANVDWSKANLAPFNLNQ